MDSKFKYFIVNLLRKGTFKWSPRNEAKKKYKVPNGTFKNGKTKYGYKCQDCNKVFKSGEIQMDHIRAVVDPIEGFIDWDTYINRMFCAVDGFCALCKNCHDNKSKKELEFRKEAKSKKEKKSLYKKYEKFLKKYEI